MQPNSIKKQQLLKPKQIIKYYDPYARLNFRYELDTIISREGLRSKIPGSIDIPTIFDAFNKRHGFYEVKKRGRIDEIKLSLSYYEYQFLKIYQDYILPYEKLILRNIKSNQVLYSQPFIQQHLLPVGQSHNYYQMNAQEISFMKQYYSSLDQYYCYKTLAHFGCDLTKINAHSLSKYNMIKKWTFLHNNHNIPTIKQLKTMRLPDQTIKQRFKICIVGINIANIILGHKLAAFGASVIIVDNSQSNIMKFKTGYSSQVIKQGIYIANSIQNGIMKKLVKQYVGVTPQLFDLSNNNQQEITVGNNAFSYQFFNEQSLISIIQQVISEPLNNSKKLLFQQIMNKVNARNAMFSQHRYYKKQQIAGFAFIDPLIIKIHLQRYLLMNKIKDQETVTVGQFRKYLDMYYCSQSGNGNKIRMAFSAKPAYLPYTNMLLNTDSIISKNIINKPKVQKQVTLFPRICLDSKFCQAQLVDRKWIVTLRSIQEQMEFMEQYTHVIYSNDYSFQKAIDNRNYIIPEIKGALIKEGFPILQQLTSHHEIHSLYRFHDGISFKQNTSLNLHCFHPNYCTYTSQYGIIHFFLYKSNKQVLAVMRSSKKYAYIDFHKQFLQILILNVLSSSFKIIKDQQIIEQCSHFSIRDERFLDNLIKVRQDEGLYFSLPVIYPSGSRNILQTHLRIGNKIITSIFKNIQKTTDFYQQYQPQEQIIKTNSKYDRRRYPDQYNDREYQQSRSRERSREKQRDKDRYSGSRQLCQDDERSHERSRQKIPRSYRQPLRQDEDRRQLSSSFTRLDRSSSGYQNRGQMRYKPKYDEKYESSKSRQNQKYRQKQKQKKYPQNSEITSIHKNLMGSLLPQNQETQYNNSDYFGINHQAIKQYSNTITHFIDKYRNQYCAGISKLFEREKLPLMGCKVYETGISNFNRVGVELYPNIYLYCIGFPTALGKNKKSMRFTNFNHCVTRRQYYSLSQPNRMTVYYQCIVVINQKQYYCIVEEEKYHGVADLSKKQIVYYHTSSIVLADKINSMVKQKRLQLKKIQPINPPFLLSESAHKPPEYLLPIVVKRLIEKQLQQCQKQQQCDIDTILDAKLTSNKSYITQDCYSLYRKDQIQMIYAQIMAYLQALLANNKLKKQYTLSDIFYGKFNPLFILCEMHGTFDILNGEGINEQIQNQNQIQIKQQRQLYNKFIQNEGNKRYPFNITKMSNGQIKLIRRFLNSSRSSQQQLGTYHTIMDAESDWLFNFYETAQKNHKDNLLNVIKASLNRYRSYEIINSFRQLIYQQLAQIDELTSQMTTYFRMTRICNCQPSQQQISNFIKNTKPKIVVQDQPLTDFDQNVFIDNYVSGNFRVIGTDIVCLK